MRPSWYPPTIASICSAVSCRVGRAAPERPINKYAVFLRRAPPRDLGINAVHCGAEPPGPSLRLARKRRPTRGVGPRTRGSAPTKESRRSMFRLRSFCFILLIDGVRFRERSRKARPDYPRRDLPLPQQAGRFPTGGTERRGSLLIFSPAHPDGPFSARIWREQIAGCSAPGWRPLFGTGKISEPIEEHAIMVAIERVEMRPAGALVRLCRWARISSGCDGAPPKIEKSGWPPGWRQSAASRRETSGVAPAWRQNTSVQTMWQSFDRLYIAVFPTGPGAGGPSFAP